MFRYGKLVVPYFIFVSLSRGGKYSIYERKVCFFVTIRKCSILTETARIAGTWVRDILIEIFYIEEKSVGVRNKLNFDVNTKLSETVNQAISKAMWQFILKEKRFLTKRGINRDVFNGKIYIGSIMNENVL